MPKSSKVTPAATASGTGRNFRGQIPLLRSAAGRVASHPDKTHFVGQRREKRRLPQAEVGAGASTWEAGLVQSRAVRYVGLGK